MRRRRFSVATLLFRASLVLFPGWFRREYEDEMVQSFVERLAQLRSEGAGPGAALFLCRALVDVPFAAVRARSGRHVDVASFFEGPSGTWLDDLGQAARSLSRAPSWTLPSILILSLGIGGTTAVFSVLNAVFLRALPFESPDALVSLWTLNRGQLDGSSWLNARDWRERGRVLDDIAFVMRAEFTDATVTTLDEPERFQIALASHSFFDVLGVQPLVGRLFTADDASRETRNVVIAEDLWVSRYGGDPDIVGRTVTVNGTAVDIVGVAPSWVALPTRDTQLWWMTEPDQFYGARARDHDAWWVLGRLRPGVGIEAARGDLERVAAELAIEVPDTNRELGVSVTSLRSEIVGDRLPLLLWTLLGSMTLVLLVGGTNVAQLMLGRALARRRELAVRGALGASRGRIGRQLLLESLLLAVASGIGGVALASLAVPVLISAIPSEVPLIDATTVDLTVLAVAVLTVGVLAPLMGLLPSLSASRTSVADILRSGGRGSTGGDRKVRSTLVVGELATAVVLLAGASLLTRSAIAINDVDPGFDADRMLIMHVNLSVPYDDALAAFEADLLSRVRALPGVEGAGAMGSFFVSRIPDQRITLADAPAELEDAPVPPLTGEWMLPGTVEAIGAPLLRGRHLSFADVQNRDETRVVLVNSAWEGAFSPDRGAVGRQFWRGRDPDRATRPFTVVGVIGDVRNTELEAVPYPEIFYPDRGTEFDLLVRTAGDPLAVAPLVREVVRRSDPGAAVSRVGSIRDRYRDGLAPRRFQTIMLGVFAAFATMLSAVGLFAILHDAVTARRREMGIRMALGANALLVMRMVLLEGWMLAVSGLAIGLALAALFSSVTARFVFGIESTDPTSFAAVAALLLATTTIASGLPAWRATAVSLKETLNDE